SPEENQDLIAFLVTMAVDSGYLPLHGAEKLLIYGLIEVREAVIDTPAGPRPIQVFEPTARAFSAAKMLRTTSVPESLGKPGKVIGARSTKRNFEALIPRGKRKWVLSRTYLERRNADDLRLMIRTVVCRWWTGLSI
ncbi:MAG: hypothetical protein ACK5II_01970, partial [Paracoccus sp. (in: a-proteobacteria)]